MFKSLIKKWDDLTFDSMIRHRVDTTREMLKKHGLPTETEIESICRMFAEELVRKNLGSNDQAQILRIMMKIKYARREIQQLFENDGHNAEFAFALSHVCVGWDMDAYKNGKLKNNLTLNCLLKKHTKYSGLLTEKMLFGRD